jgi:membrane associated rhomboid family serine protease
METATYRWDLMPEHRVEHGLGSIQFTLGMVVLFIAVFIAEWMEKNLAPLQAFPWRLGNFESWRLVTSTVLHGSILHVVFNTIWFLRFNQAIERWLGPWMAVALYAVFAVGSGAPQAVFAGGGGGLGAIGASGVVYGLFGFLWVCRRRYDIAAEAVPPQVVQIMLGWIVVCAVVNFFGGNIGNTAHIFGLLFGWLLGQIVVARHHIRPRLIAGTAALWLLLLSLTWLPVWQRTLKHIPVIRSQYSMVEDPRDDWESIDERRFGVIPVRRAF